MRLALSKASYWFLGFFTCLSLLIEQKKRRGELASASGPCPR